MNFLGVARVSTADKKFALVAFCFFTAASLRSAELSTNSAAVEQIWNWHVQNTDIVQGYPGFSSKYSGPNSLPNGGQTRETVSLDLLGGVRLWRGAEAHIDGLMYQGFGVDTARGVDGFPNHQRIERTGAR